MKAICVIVGLLPAARCATHTAGFQPREQAYGRADYAAAFAQLEPFVKQGNALAQFSFGDVYEPEQRHV
jgi:hypothetical protein